MATIVSSALFPTNATNADFRAWAQFVYDTFVTTGGWVQTSDTGQLTISTAIAPVGANSKVGYHIYRMNDALQATAPVYVKIYFGSGSSATLCGMWLAVGMGSNGSGTLTSILWDDTATLAPTLGITAASAVGAHNSYGSASTSRCQLGMFVQTTAGRILFLSIERAKNTSGQDVDDGLLVYYTSPSTGGTVSRYLVYAVGAQPLFEPGMNWIGGGNNPTAFGSDVGVGVPIPLCGVAQPPGTGVTIVASSDFVVETQFSMSLYGATRVYQHLNSFTTRSAQNASAVAQARVCIRFD